MEGVSAGRVATGLFRCSRPCLPAILGDVGARVTDLLLHAKKHDRRDDVRALISNGEEDQAVIPRHPPSNYRKELKVFIL